MQPQLIWLLYSGFSPICEQLFEIIREAPVDITNLLGIQHICADDEVIREIILESDQINIKHVPCVLVAYANGTVETYVGIRAFQWVEKTIRENMPRAPTPTPTPLPPLPQQSTKSSNKPHSKRRYKEETVTYDQDLTRELDNLPEDEHTLIDDETIQNIEMIDQDMDIEPDPSGMGDGDIEDFSMMTAMREMQGRPKQAGGPKESLMQAAEAMQRDREASIESQAPPGMPTHMRRT